jgi:hypothetical protein
MNDAKLQDKGVAALGARRKLLKVSRVDRDRIINAQGLNG